MHTASIDPEKIKQAERCIKDIVTYFLDLEAIQDAMKTHGTIYYEIDIASETKHANRIPIELALGFRKSPGQNPFVREIDKETKCCLDMPQEEADLVWALILEIKKELKKATIKYHRYTHGMVAFKIYLPYS